MVTTPAGFTDAWGAFVDGGWPGLSMPEEFGGQDLPESVDLILNELMGGSNHSFAMYHGLTEGCRNTQIAH